MSNLPKSMRPRDVICVGGPHHGVILEEFTTDKFLYNNGSYSATGRWTNNREEFQWKEDE